MGKATFVGGKIGMEAPITYIGDPVFSNNDWATIIEACQKNNIHPTWEIGDQKTMTINGADYAIDIIGKNHDDYADGSGKAPLTFQMHDLYVTTHQMNSSNYNTCGWINSVMRVTNLPTIFALMPSEVQVAIKEVNKLTSAGGTSATINTTADTIFLLSEIEVYGNTTHSFVGEGSQYDYYAAGNSKAKTNANERYWWLRSPWLSDSKAFCSVNDSETVNTFNASTTLGVAFAFCF